MDTLMENSDDKFIFNSKYTGCNLNEEESKIKVISYDTLKVQVHLNNSKLHIENSKLNEEMKENFTN